MNMIDLHSHSNYSDDGEFTPEALIALAKQNNLSYYALSDHNTTKGVISLLKSEINGITLIPAIELDVRFQDIDFHLLGYGINPYDSTFETIEDNILKQEYEGTKHRLDYTRNTLMLQCSDEDLAMLSSNGVYSAETIMEACMMKKENELNPYMKPYLKGGERSDNPLVNYYWDHFSQGKDGYFKMKYPSMIDMIQLIHQQGGIAILAHPGNNVKEDLQLLTDIISLGIDGIEVYSSYHNTDQVNLYHEVALEHNLMMTCGSDFHGKTKPTITMGQHTMPIEEQKQLISVLSKFKKPYPVK